MVAGGAGDVRGKLVLQGDTVIEKWEFAKIEQLGFDLDLGDNPAKDASMEASGGESAEAVRVRAETARRAAEMRLEAAGEEFSWLEHYLMLREAGWDWKAAIYVAWAASPKHERYPKTLEELATQFLGLSGPRRIFEWKRKNPAMEDTIAMLQAAPLLQHRADIYSALITVASDPDYKGHQDRKLALELLGDYTPRADQNIRVSGAGIDLSGLSEEELARLAGVVSETEIAAQSALAMTGEQEAHEMTEGEDE